MRPRLIKPLPTGEAHELPDDEAWKALYEHFNWPDQPTEPVPLEFPPLIKDDEND